MQQKASIPQVCDILLVKVYRGQIQKSHLDTQKSLRWKDFQKLKAERMPVNMVMFLPPF